LPEQLFDALWSEQPSKGHIHLNALTVKKVALLRMHNWFNTALRLHQDTEFIARLAYSASLVPGLVGRAVSVRGVHVGNRITKHVKGTSTYHQYQAVMCLVLYQWSDEQHLARRYRSMFYFRFIFHEFSCLSPSKRAFKYMVLVFSGKRALRDLKYSAMVHHMFVVGKIFNSRIARKLAHWAGGIVS